MYDLEQLATDMGNICKNNLNTKLAAIDAEKNDGTTMTQIPPEAYFFQSLTNTAAGFPAFLFFSIDNPVSDGDGPFTAQQVVMNFIVVLKNTAERDVLMQRVLRYQRALKEIFEENYSKMGGRGRISISGLSPVDFGILNMQGTFKGVGVQIKTAIA